MGPTHHVGIAVRKLEPAIERYKALGLELDYTDTVAGQGVRVAFLKAGSAHIELVEPTDPTGTVARFIERRGEGLHHIAFTTDDIVGDLRHLEDEGFELIDRVPRAGARGRFVAFVHPRSTHGVLIELVEEPRGTHSRSQKS